MKISKVGIFGNGHVGSALARGAMRAGYEVKTVGNDQPTIRQIATWADLSILAVPFGAIAEVVEHAELGLSGKTLVDVTNPVGAHMELLVGFSTSGAEELQRRLPKARVVKAFNTVFAQHMDTGHLADSALTAFVAADDVEAKATVLTLARQIGFEGIDAGGLAMARYLEPLAALNIHLGYAMKLGPHIAFKLLHG